MVKEGPFLEKEDRAVGGGGAGGSAANVRGLGGGRGVGERVQRRKELLRKEYDLFSVCMHDWFVEGNLETVVCGYIDWAILASLQVLPT